MRPKEAVQRVQELERMGRISGVVDDRGKFVYITAREPDAVRQFIEGRGRVSQADIAEASNRLIRLQPLEGEADPGADEDVLAATEGEREHPNPEEANMPVASVQCVGTAT